MNNELTIEELQTLKELINKLDDDKKMFKMTNEIIEIRDKQLIKEDNKYKGENK